MRCTCGRVVVGMKVTNNRNWDPDCIHHGTESRWWNSPEEVARREAQRQQLEELWAKAREKRHT